VTLNPKAALNVGLTLILPATVAPGCYASDIVVTSVARGGGFARETTGAATSLRFTVRARR
jgi:hypothetical protein